MHKGVICNWDKLPVLLDLHTVAMIFNVTDYTVKQWIYKGLLKGSRIGRKYFFDKDYIRSLIVSGGRLEVQ